MSERGRHCGTRADVAGYQKLATVKPSDGAHLVHGMSIRTYLSGMVDLKGRLTGAVVIAAPSK